MSGSPSIPLLRLALPVRSRSALCGIVLLSGVLGCGTGPQAEFGWRDSTQALVPVAQKSVQNLMTENFGTPQQLVGWERMPVDYGGTRAEVAAVGATGQFTISLADSKLAERIQPGQTILWLTGAKTESTTPVTVEKFDSKTLTVHATAGAGAGDKLLIGFGSQLQLGRKVYMQNCTHCHGVAGDAQGPTAKYLNPRPRDFRLGILKFTSTQSAERANRDDIYRTVSHGIPGTYMPSFLLMAEHEKRAVVEYVRWLAMRGEMEKRIDDELADYNKVTIKSEAKSALEAYNAAVESGEKPEEKPYSEGQMLANAKTGFATYEKEEFPDVINQTADFLAETWAKADEPDSVIKPKLARADDSAESRRRGRVLYMSNRTKCYTCHGPLGRGDGGAVDDFWPKPGTSEKYDKRGLHDLWGNKLEPRNLTLGQYRGGRRPVDLYRRVFAGIKGTPMPAFGGTVLKDEEIWDLVNYVMSIPFEPKSPMTPKAPALASHAEDAKPEH